ncbi:MULTISPECIES: M15 family metallopeptidase [Arthrobacter]|uniref:M15 family metallopeptidase n=2 Tax=Arthrobacter TaxID=1663 RepID=A0ABU9KQ59_9MICC|nr:M15 family metallopeptidase [Arthrobacter sp. YJM1]MDP5228039.1 M15 family metallopeptidase [Arthrobacter sp. YJM1]
MDSRRRAFLTTGLLGAGAAALSACTPSAAPSAGSTTTARTTASPTPAASGSPSATPSARPTITTPPKPPAPYLSLPGKHFSFDDPRSPWVVVNKRRPLRPVDFVPPDLRQPAVSTSASGELALVNATTATAAESMFAAASADGVGLVLASGYRSHATQLRLYGSYAAARGTADADTASARPGFSEHQTGWAFDLEDSGGACAFLPCFADQPAAQWAAARAAEFGFIVRYRMDQEHVTGYLAEPWHLRYIGVAAALDMRRKGIKNLEDYFGIPAAPGYL